jgi:hypothetical protein
MSRSTTTSLIASALFLVVCAPACAQIGQGAGASNYPNNNPPVGQGAGYNNNPPIGQGAGYNDHPPVGQGAGYNNNPPIGQGAGYNPYNNPQYGYGNRPPDPYGVRRRRLYLYPYPNFQGRPFVVENDLWNLDRTGFNDRAVSARAEGPWEVCRDANFRGGCTVIYGSRPYLGDFAHNISSVRPR